MAANLNRVMLIGNLTRDPELRYIPSGQGVTTFTVAVNRTYVANTGEKKEEVSFIRVVVWGKRAEVCHEYLRKGSPVFVEGRLQSRSWDGPDGTKRSTIEVVAQNVQFLGRGTGAKAEPASEIPAPEETITDDSFGSEVKGKSVAAPKTELSPDEEVPF
ncbi:MAG TPA: single-stranded DNA-binding protein [Candidatus Omnitrophota bacterium]|nr:single-stranded DNA-binding protein [Candidatus Omnitrophota bacterium]